MEFNVFGQWFQGIAFVFVFIASSRDPDKMDIEHVTEISIN
jgi:hypothetical protein